MRTKQKILSISNIYLVCDYNGEKKTMQNNVKEMSNNESYLEKTLQYRGNLRQYGNETEMGHFRETHLRGENK